MSAARGPDEAGQLVLCLLISSRANTRGTYDRESLELNRMSSYSILSYKAQASPQALAPEELTTIAHHINTVSDSRDSAPPERGVMLHL